MDASLETRIASLRDDARFERLCALLESLESVAVAYSGGVDSAFLLLVAQGVLGDRARGVLAYSDSIDRIEFEAARKLAAEWGLRIETVDRFDHVVLFFTEKSVLGRKQRRQPAGACPVDQFPGMVELPVDRGRVA